MFNVCFVFDAQTDPVAYTPFVKQLAQDFKALEVEVRTSLSPDALCDHLL